jgi:transcriptional regulator with XRE-family HTH domain
MAEPREPTWRARWLGQKLRELRKNKGLSINDVAERLECGPATVNRFETGVYPVKPEEMILLMTLFGVSGRDERDELMQLAQEVADRGWVESLVSDRSFADFVWAEGMSRHIRSFQLAVFPGIIQAPAFAEAVIELGKAQSDAEKGRLLEARLARGRVLRKPQAPEARFLIHEAVFHQRIKGLSGQVYRAQFEHLIQVAELPNVRLRMAPLHSGAHSTAGVSTGFTILEMRDSWPTLVHVETPLGAMVAETPDIDTFTATYDGLWEADVLDEKHTLVWLSTMLKELEA